MIDIKLIRENPQKVKENIKKKFQDDKLALVDKVKKQKHDWVFYAKKILTKAGRKIILPIDLVIANSLKNPTETKVVKVSSNKKLIDKGWTALDIGPETQKLFQEKVKDAKTIFWNGPMGLFENKRFAKGSTALAKNGDLLAHGFLLVIR